MRRATAICRETPKPALDVATVTLAFAERHRRRFRLTDDGGAPFLLDLAETAILGDGDGLILEDGGVIRVIAAAEAVADIRGRDARHTARLAWHLGNRHTPVQILDDGGLRILDDHVLIEMAQGLGAEVTRRDAPFTPEPGAYSSNGQAHGHEEEEGHAH